MLSVLMYRDAFSINYIDQNLKNSDKELKKKLYNKSCVNFDKNGEMNYSDNLTYGFNHGNKIHAEILKLNEYESENLLKTIIYDNFKELNAEIISINLLKCSWLYRVSKSYKYYHHNTYTKKINNKTKALNCLDLASFIYNIKNYEFIDTFKINNYTSDKIDSLKNNCEFAMNNFFMKGLILEEDYKEAMKFKEDNFNLEIQSMAMIKGRRFSSRGCQFRQTSHSTNSKPNFNVHNLKSSWHEKFHYSSWFKLNKDQYLTYEELCNSGEEFRNYFINTYEYATPIDFYGQFNFFFKIHNEDILINNKLYASVIVRKTMDLSDKKTNYMLNTSHSDGIQHMRVIQMNEKEALKCFVHNMIFISESLVHSSPILVLPIVANETWSTIKAIKPDSNDTSKIFSDSTYEQFYETNKYTATDLFMIDMERYRMTSTVTNPEGWGFVNKS
jgi:hypothetical protein